MRRSNNFTLLFISLVAFSCWCTSFAPFRANVRRTSFVSRKRKRIITHRAASAAPNNDQGEYGDKIPTTVSNTSKPVLTWDHVALMPSNEIAYFYLTNELGLDDDVMWKITLEYSSVLGFRVSTLQKKVSFLRNEMDLDDDDVRQMISAQPTLLNLSVENNMKPTIALLIENLSFNKKELRELMLAVPAVLCYSIEDNLIFKLAFFLITLGLTPVEAKRLFLKEPRLLTCSVDLSLIPKYNFFHVELLLTPDEIKTMTMKDPIIFVYNLEENLRKKIVDFFMLTLSMDEAQIRALLVKYPLVLRYSLEDHVKPIARYFLNELEYSKTGVPIY